MIKPVLPFLETMVTYNCNLSCTGCTNYSDYNMTGAVSWDQCSDWIKSWLQRVDIPDFGIIGGEPLMHPEISHWIFGLRNLLPNSQIRFTTNGKLLLKKFDVVKNLLEIGNTVIKLTVHQPQEFYTQEASKLLFSCADWTPIVEHGINRWAGPNNTKLQINFPQTFVKTYQGHFKNMTPHNSDPTEAFNHCIQQQCPLLYNGRIFKCSSIALLERVTTDWQQNTNSMWDPYLNYKGIDSLCTDSELLNFISGFGRPESICSMCPGDQDHQSFLPHNRTVTSKSHWIKLHHARS